MPIKRDSQAAARQRWREKQREIGLCQISVWIPEKRGKKFKFFARLLAEGDRPSAAFKKAFPSSANALTRERN